MHQLDIHKKSVLHYWKTQQEENPKRFDTGADAMIPDAMQWLGVYEDQLPGVTPADARAVLLDWRAGYLADPAVAPGRPEG